MAKHSRIFLACPFLLSITAIRAERKDFLLNDNWMFRFSHQVPLNSARCVDLPHTWNAQDALAGE